MTIDEVQVHDKIGADYKDAYATLVLFRFACLRDGLPLHIEVISMVRVN